MVEARRLLARLLRADDLEEGLDGVRQQRRPRFDDELVVEQPVLPAAGGDVDLDEGELIVVPKGVEHCPIALSDTVHCLLVERGTTLNTGSAAESIGDTVHESGSVPLTKKELPRL